MRVVCKQPDYMLVGICQGQQTQLLARTVTMYCCLLYCGAAGQSS
jgi:hypothetical protein